MRKIVLLFILSILACFNANAEYLIPTDIELRAVYCRAVIRSNILLADEIIKFDHITAEQNILVLEAQKKDITNHERINSYLLPRMSKLDPYSMNSVVLRGEIDAKKYDKEAKERKSFCENINWLPF